MKMYVTYQCAKGSLTNTGLYASFLIPYGSWLDVNMDFGLDLPYT
jgi:hypothetical protein